MQKVSSVKAILKGNTLPNITSTTTTTTTTATTTTTTTNNSDSSSISTSNNNFNDNNNNTEGSIDLTNIINNNDNNNYNWDIENFENYDSDYNGDDRSPLQLIADAAYQVYDLTNESDAEGGS